MRRRPRGGAVHPQLLLLALACLLGVDACWRSDLPALATRSTAASDAAVLDVPDPAPDPAPSKLDAAENVTVVAPENASDAAPVAGQIALSLSMPVDTSTGQVVTIGSVSLQLTAPDPAAGRTLTLQLGQPRQQVRIDLAEIPAGGPYTLQASATAGGVACATSTLPFSVMQAETVRVFLALICEGDAGWSATL